MRQIIFAEPSNEFYAGKWTWYIRYACVNDKQTDTGLVSGTTLEEAEKAAEKVRDDFMEVERQATYADNGFDAAYEAKQIREAENEHSTT